MSLAAVSSYAQKYNFKPFDLEVDLGVSAVSNMANSPEGYLLLSGDGEIYVFDGKSADLLMEKFFIPFTEIRNMRSDLKGALFLLANDRLFQLGNGNPLISEPINTYVTQGSKVFYGNKNGLKIFDRSNNLIDRPDAISKLQDFEINDLVLSNEPSDADLFITSSRGLFRYDIKTKLLDGYTQTDGKELEEAVIDESGSLWTYDARGTVYKIDLETKNTTPYYNEDFEINNLAIDSSNRVWIGTKSKGILLYDQSQDSWKTIDQRNGLSDNRVLDILTDSWGIVWIVTADQVLSKFIDRDYELFNVYDGMASDKVDAVYATENQLVFSAGGKGIYEFGRNTFRTLYDLDVKSEAIFKDSINLWVGTSGNGLIRINNSESTVFRKNAGLPSDWVNHISKAADGSMWIGTPSNGLAHLIQRDSLGIQIIKYSLEEGLVDEYITAMHTSSLGVTYYGTRSGRIGQITGEIHSMLPAKMISSEVTDIEENEMGEIFFSTLAHGIIRISNGKDTALEKLAGYPDNIKALSWRDGLLWAANDRGIYNGKNAFTSADGFPANSITKGSLVNFQGRSWVGSAAGLISLGALAERTISRIPKIHFESVQANYDSISFNGEDGKSVTRINYDENQISFEYRGVDIHSTKDLTYSYILEGADKEWSPWSKNDNPSFNNLSPGNYTFMVKAKSDNGAISTPLIFAFIINGPIWKEWWFIPAVALGFSLLIFLLFRARIKTIRKKNADEKAQLELKNRLLELEQKANQLQMNPHFIFNALNSIQATVSKENYHDARREITDFATLMRSILSNSKERMISLEDELLLLRKYIDIEKKCRTLSFDYEFDIAHEIDGAEVQIPPMLIQPFVENAIIHGLAKKNGGKLLISFSLLEENIMQVSVIDDGVGYEKSKASNADKKHKSVAIEVTKERLEALVDKKYFPVLEIRQKDDNGGTVVTLKMPIEYEF